MSWRLVPDDSEFALIYRRTENILNALSQAGERSTTAGGSWRLPTALRGGEALGALLRTGAVLRDAMDAFSVPPPEAGHSARPRLFAEGRELAPLRVVWISQTDIDALAEAHGATNLTLAPVRWAAGDDPEHRNRLDDLAELLNGIDPDPHLWAATPHPRSPEELLQPLARLIVLLDLFGDDDITILLAVLQANPTADVELTPRQAAAYYRLSARINLLLTDGEVVHRNIL